MEQNKINKLSLNHSTLNGKPCYMHSSIMEYFGCTDLKEFKTKYLEPTRDIINKYGEEHKNHIIYITSGELKFYLFSQFALYCLSVVTQDHNLDEYVGDCKYDIKSLFTSPSDSKTEIRTYDNVEILVDSPDIAYQQTATICYRGMTGTVVKRHDNGHFEVVVSERIPAAMFKRESLKLLSK